MNQKDVTRADVIKAYDIIDSMQQHTNEVMYLAPVRDRMITRIELYYRLKPSNKLVDFHYKELHLNTAFQWLIGEDITFLGFAHSNSVLSCWLRDLEESFGTRRELVLNALLEVLE